MIATGDAESRFAAWYTALEARHLASLTFQEVRRALEALSITYVEKRAPAAALDGAGKRAAFALFYGPLHFLVVQHVVRDLGAAAPGLECIVDLGCGTGVGSAAWGLAAQGAQLHGVDRNTWVLEEARWNWSHFGLTGTAERADVLRAELARERSGVLAAYLVNELDDSARHRLLGRLLEAAKKGARVLVIEPIARRALPWWPTWEQAFGAAGGRSDTWRLAAQLPPRLRLLDKAAGLDHRELTARSLFVGP